MGRDGAERECADVRPGKAQSREPANWPISIRYKREKAEQTSA